MSNAMSSTRGRALQLLGSGIGPEITASALGVTPSYISQLLSEEEFAQEVATLRFNSLQKHNTRDSAYDTLEDELIESLQRDIPLMRTMERVKFLQIVNAAKRRGASAPEQITHQNQVINLVMPTQIINHFKTTVNNIVTNASGQELLTMQSSTLLEKFKNSDLNSALKEIGNDTPTVITSPEVTHCTN